MHPASSIKVLIGGDTCPILRNGPGFSNGDAHAIFHDLVPEFEQADFSLVNLECPLIESSSPIRKSGPVLGAPSSCIHGLLASRIGAVGLANNHILDHGEPGLRNTLQLCSQANIVTIGAGLNLAEASQVVLVQVGSIRVGILGIADQEWCIATPTSGGANPMDPMQIVRSLQRAEGAYDFLVVLVHGGAENYFFPSPRLRELCHFLVEQGAGMVICQHSHCAGCHEQYRGRHIIYGQGNLIFDTPGRAAPWYEGFLVEMTIQADGAATWRPVPYHQSDTQAGARKMNVEQQRVFLEALDHRSQLIQQTGYVEQAWNTFCEQRRHSVLSDLLGHGRVLRRLNRNGQVVNTMYGERNLLQAMNYLRCDIHREVVLNALSRYLKL
jgi:poly-gamma-glutamate capsule biosynthesis protein CapA/YwtB (metallophosphatase superfamily)